MTNPTTATDELRQWFERELPDLIKVAGEVLAAGEQQAPILVVISQTDQKAIVNLPLIHGTEDKDLIAFAHREMAAMPRVKAAILVMETWMRTFGKGEMPAIVPTSISGDPKREEAILFNCLSGDMQLIASCRIVRPANTLEAPVIVDPNGKEIFMHGRMIREPAGRQ